MHTEAHGLNRKASRGSSGSTQRHSEASGAHRKAMEGPLGTKKDTKRLHRKAFRGPLVKQKGIESPLSLTEWEKEAPGRQKITWRPLDCTERHLEVSGPYTKELAGPCI